MNCVRDFCNGQMQLVDECEASRFRGNNYDIVVWEQVWECSQPKCAIQHTVNETTTEGSVHDDGLATTPARFDT